MSETPEKTMTLVAAINAALHEAMAEDERVVVLGEDIADPVGGVMRATAGLSTAFGEHRVRDTPIAEAAIMGAAAGMAMGGLRPVAEIMINDFITIAMDQLVNLAAKHHFTTRGSSSMPLTVRVGVASGLGSGATHSQSLEAWLMHIPGLKVGAACTPHDAKGMLASAIRDPDPCVLFEDYRSYQVKGAVPTGHYVIPIGQADIKRAGTDVTLISYGWTVHTCLEAAKALQSEGIDAEVLDLRWLVPMDVDAILRSVSKTRRAIIVHGATQFCGAGAEIGCMIQERLFGKLEAPVRRVAAPYIPAPAAKVLEDAYFPSVAKIVAAVQQDR